MKKGIGICPGKCGELIQGYMDGEECVSSYCVDLFSKVTISEKVIDKPIKKYNKKKSIEAISLVLDYFGIDRNEIENMDINIKSNIPIGKGMASSTADIGASIMAILSYLEKDMPVEDIAMLAAKVEPTDSLFYRDICIFNPIKGRAKVHASKLSSYEVLVLEPRNKINTVKIRAQKDYYKIVNENKQITENAFKTLIEGLNNDNRELLKNACESSALANERVKKTPYIREIMKIADEYGAKLVNIAHTGTIVGVVLDDNTEKEKLIDVLRNSDISKVYKKQYVRKIIEGGLRKG